MKTNNRRRTKRSEDAHLYSWNSFISFIFGFLWDGAVVLAPISSPFSCPFEMLDGFLVDYWIHIFWWFSIMNTMACFSYGSAKIWLYAYMNYLCVLRIARIFIVQRIMACILCARNGGFCCLLSLTNCFAESMLCWGLLETTNEYFFPQESYLVYLGC
jgi:hypothetical protein